MANIKEIVIPDIGGVTDVPVIEILVKAGDKVSKEQGLITLESDKATMEVPSADEGVVKEIFVKVGDKVSAGVKIISLEIEAEAQKPAEKKSVEQEGKKPTASTKVVKEIPVPDIGTADAVPVIEIHVKPGDQVEIDSALLTLESDKATMDLPSPMAGIVKEVKIKVKDKVKQGDVVILIEGQEVVKAAAKADQPKSDTKKEEKPAPAPMPVATTASVSVTTGEVHAGPAVRRLAREFGVNLSLVKGTGQKNRIIKEDVQNYVKAQLQSGGGSALPQAPVVDFTKFGKTESQPLSRIKKLSGKFLHRNWLLVPHVTQFIDADITDLEDFRKAQKQEAEKQGVKLTPLVFIMKAVVSALKEFPQFNASLDASGENLILKKYFHIGVAVDTPDGLVVPVIRDVDQKGVFDLAKELSVMSEKARNKQLSNTDMQGGCFSISSLGGIGGNAFTPIVNLPEVAILGVSKAAHKPVYQNEQFIPRLMLPLSLSYDHRVIDGADGARFAVFIANKLADIRGLLL